MEISVPRKDRGYTYPTGKAPAYGVSGVTDRTRGLVLVRLLRDGRRDVAVMLGLLPDGRRPGWWAGPLVEAGLRRLGVVV